MFFSKKLKKFENIKHCFFSRKNGFSKGHYLSLNCGLGSGDKKENVLKNLNLVSKKIGCKNEALITLNQIHSNKVLYIENKSSIKNKLPGDAIITKIKNIFIIHSFIKKFFIFWVLIYKLFIKISFYLIIFFSNTWANYYK